MLDFFARYEAGWAAHEQGEHFRRLRRQAEENTGLP
jgi:hypothetical protein